MNVIIYVDPSDTVAVIDTAPTPPPPPPPPPPSGSIVALALTFQAAGYQPFFFGQYFCRGDVPAGAQLVADCAEFQAAPWSYYDDGSWRFAEVAGYCTVTAPGLVSVTMRLGTPSAGSTVAPITSPVKINGQGPTKTTTVNAGPVMRHEEHTHVVDSLVRYVYETVTFRKGEVLTLAPRIENAGFSTAAQPNRVLPITVTISGVGTFNETVDAKHHTWPTAMRGSSWTYGPNPQPQHDRVYAARCESLLPMVIGNVTMPAVSQSYFPNALGDVGRSMDKTGGGPYIGLLARANLFYLTKGNKASWDYMWSEALAAGSFSVYRRDEATGELPRMATYPKASLLSGTLPLGSGGENHDTYQGTNSVDTSHEPSFCYTAAIVTGWKRFRDQHLAWALHNHWYQHYALRGDTNGIIRSNVGANQDRGAAWALRTLAQAIALTPATSPHLPDLVNAWKQNMLWYKAQCITGPWAGELGLVPVYSSNGTSLYATEPGTAWWGSAWMQSFMTMSLGMALRMKMPIGDESDTRAMFMHSAKLVVGLFGLDWIWRRGGPYAMPFAANGNATLPQVWYTFKQAYAEYIGSKGLQALDPANGGTIKRHSSETDINAGDWTGGYPGEQWAALVFAVIHKAPGADAALARVMSSPSWPLIAAGVNEPVWAGMMPPGYKHPGAL